MTKAFFLAIFLLILAPAVVFASSDVDSDDDGLSDEEEAIYHTDPENSDTDWDGYTDGEEVKNGYSPLFSDGKKMFEVDFDSDGLNDWLEIQFRSDLTKPETDKDGFNDFDEVMYGYSPVDPSPQSRLEKLVEVDKARQHLYYYVSKIKVLDYPVSTGVRGMETPSGNFKIISKAPVKHYAGPGFNYPNAKWNLEFKKGVYLHGAYWHNDFGVRSRSHGCVNMRTEDAEALYKYTSVGVKVVVK